MTFDSNVVFQAEFDKAIIADVEKSGFPVEQWFMNGRSKPADAVATWRERGPRLVDRFISWFESSGYQVWITPDGRPAIELELRPVFGEIQVHMFIDLILQNQLGLCVVDSKSGYKTPESLQQLGIYASGVELIYDTRPLYGAHYLARGVGKRGCSDDDKTYFQTPRPLSAYHHSVAYWTAEFARFDRLAKGGDYLSRVGEHCDRCGVAGACLAVGGDRAAEFDPAHPHHSIRKGLR